MPNNVAIPRPGVVERASTILRVVAQAQVIGVSELARESGLAKTTAHRLAKDLVAAGLLERANDGFRLGYGLFELGSHVIGPRHLREAAIPIMEQLLHVTGHTVHLAVLRDREVSYIERIFAQHHSARLPSSVAGRLPLHCTATGKCFLAFGPQSLRDSIPVDRRLARELSDVRSQGTAREVGEVLPEAASVAAPVFGLGQRIEAALSVTGFIDAFDPEQVVHVVQEASATLSELLGAKGSPKVE